VSGLGVLIRAATLPDPGNPSIIALAGALGGLVGGTVAEIRQLPPERVTRATVTGSRRGAGLGFAGYLLVLAIDRL
jgi:hypothetical protein